MSKKLNLAPHSIYDTVDMPNLYSDSVKNLRKSFLFEKSNLDDSRKPVDLILSARWVVPVIPENTVLENYSVIIDDEVIIDMLPILEAEEVYVMKDIDHADNIHHFFEHHMLIPGLINMHTHNGLTFLRGIAEDKTLMQWLEEYIWPTEKKFVSPKFVEDAVTLSVVESLRNGITTFNDMYFHPEVTAKVVEKCGMKALLGVPIMNIPNNYSSTEKQSIDMGVELIEKYKDHPRVQICLAPHAPYTVSDESFERIAEISRTHGLKIHVHLHETAWEVEKQEERPFARLKRLGVINENTIAIHMTQLTDEEIAECAEIGVSIVHCPCSNLKLSSGICPVKQCVSSGVNVCLGTDSVASNDDLDLLSELRTAALIDKLKVGPNNPSLKNHQLLELATINGARALGLDDKIGSLEIGKKADIVAIKINTEPIYHIFSNIAYTGTNKVTDVWIDGNRLLKDGVTKLDEPGILKNAKQWGIRIQTFLDELHKERANNKEQNNNNNNSSYH
eukprot:TRINITY_DN15198_c0_g1_i1.p1 TRINITY_DN15198_c0_g1~~TRINITY_DN15198_c0_g1_i1.p1  ORF type:complete len:505 (+),score=159.00 TRINITY_DN15198_c0_g1_i1:31-1545(+)